MNSFRRLIALFLLFGMMANCLNYWVLASSYAFNKAYISSVLCTNKDRPELHCEGKCFMDIKLKELEQKNKQDQETLKRSIETVAPLMVNLLAPVYETNLPATPTYYLQKKPTTRAIGIFHPPQQA